MELAIPAVLYYLSIILTVDLEARRCGLTSLPEEDIQKQCQYYCEMIDDRIEDGMTEEDAIAGIDLPEPPPVAQQPKPRKSLPVWAIILLVAGAPVWLSLVIAAAAASRYFL